MPPQVAGKAAAGGWREVGGQAGGVLVRRHELVDLNVTLVLGQQRALVVDTHSHRPSARELFAAIRSVTSLPLVAVNTHTHFDHCLGNALFAELAAAEGWRLELWGHPRGAVRLRDRAAQVRAEAAEWFTHHNRPDDATAVGGEPTRPPNRLVPADTPAAVDLGGRVVELSHPGPGHTDHDLVVQVPDAGVSILGDLVEEGAPPDWGDADPAWPRTLTALLPRLGPVVVPGHGAVVDPGFVARQRDELAADPRAARGAG